ncbi:MAG: L,D-transpeptidase [Bacteroidales bacterium]|nr:L,D-transpeptidase [Bacteroidales bacterium]
MDRFFWLVFEFFCLVDSKNLATPPRGSIAGARQHLSEAAKNLAPKYAPYLYAQAQNKYDSAMWHWNTENKKLFFNRDYAIVETYAVLSIKFAKEAIAKANKNKLSTKQQLEISIEDLKLQIDRFGKQYGHFPFDAESTRALTHCKLLLNEGISAYEKNNLHLAIEKTGASLGIINDLNIRYKTKLTEYFNGYLDWKNNVDGTIALSKRQQGHAVIVDKYARECLLFKNGALIKKFNIELGQNWIGDKNYQGDKSTPEGQYKVVSKKQHGQTKYHKALLLDYPNLEDKIRFDLNKKNGAIHAKAKIGGLIEIHGHGGKGHHWTEGCVALTNQDMDYLFATLPLGTKVTIVGSVKPLFQIINEANE